MRNLLILLALFLALPASAQEIGERIDTAADYVEPGQDADGYAAWIREAPYRADWVAILDNYLRGAGVADVVPTWQLLRTASDWRKCNDSAFELPPSVYWANIVNTLRYARDYVVPAVGQVEAVSVYRNPELNACAGGSARSAHRSMFAVDLVPRYPYERNELMRRLCIVHADRGRIYNIGFGFYQGIRFHIDDAGYRIWGVTEAEGGWACAAALQRREEARDAETTSD